MAIRKGKQPVVGHKLDASFAKGVSEQLRIWRGQQGDPYDRVLTVRDLSDAGLITMSASSAVQGGGVLSPGDSVGGGGTTDPELDLSIPAAATALQAVAAMATIILSWTASASSNVDHYEIWRNTADTLNGSEFLLASTTADVYADPVGSTSVTYYYWVRPISTAGIEGPYNAALGVSATTLQIDAPDFVSTIAPVELMDTLTANDDASNFDGRQAFLTSDGKLYRYVGDPAVSGAWTTAIDFIDIDGSTKPEDNATQNTITRSLSSAPPSTPTNGDLWYQTDTKDFLRYTGAAWEIVSTNGATWSVDVDNQPSDSALLNSLQEWGDLNNKELHATAGANVNDWNVNFDDAPIPDGVGFHIRLDKANNKVWPALKAVSAGGAHLHFELEIVGAEFTSAAIDTPDFEGGEAPVWQAGDIDFDTDDLNAYAPNGILVTYDTWFANGDSNDSGGFTVDSLDADVEFRLRIVYFNTIGADRLTVVFGDTMAVSKFPTPSSPMEFWFSPRDGAEYDALLLTNGPAAPGADVTLDNISGTGVNLASARYSMFEEGILPPMWDLTAKGTKALAIGEGYFGGDCFKMTATDNGYYLYLSDNTFDEFNISLVPNKKWIISGFLKADAASETARLYLKTEDSTFKSILITTSATPDTWERFSGVIDLTANSSAKANMRLDNSLNGQVVYYDGLMLEEQEGTLEVPSAYARPGGSQAGYEWDATSGATWDSNVDGQPADADLLNAQQDWDEVQNIPTEFIYNTDDATFLGFNPSFSAWSGSLPDGYGLFGNEPPISKETSNVITGDNGVRFVTAASATGIVHTSPLYTNPLPDNTFILGSVRYYLNSYTSGALGLAIDIYYSATLSRRTIVEFTNYETGRWLVHNYIARLEPAENIYRVRIYVMGSWAGFAGGAFTGDVIYDSLYLSLTNSEWEDIVGTNKPADNADVTTDQLAGSGINACHPRYSLFEESVLPPITDTTGRGTTTLGVDDGYFGGDCLKLGATGTDYAITLHDTVEGPAYNVNITPNKKWIISGFAKCDAASETGSFYLKLSTGSFHSVIFYTSATPDTFERFSGVIDLTAYDETTCLIRLDNDSNPPSGTINMWFDGLMIEEQIGTLETPSAYVRPGQTTASGDWGATLGATWGTDIDDQPADSVLLNSLQEWGDVNNREIRPTAAANVNDWNVTYDNSPIPGTGAVGLHIRLDKAGNKVWVEAYAPSADSTEFNFELEIIGASLTGAAIAAPTMAAGETPVWQAGDIDWANDTDHAYAPNGLLVLGINGWTVGGADLVDGGGFTVDSLDESVEFRLRITGLVNTGTDRCMVVFGDTVGISAGADDITPIEFWFSARDGADYDALLLTNGPAEAGATLGAIWGDDIDGQPTDASLLNDQQLWEEVQDVPLEYIMNADDASTLGFNPTFEAWTSTYPKGWTLFSNDYVSKETTNVLSGSNALHLTIPTGVANGGIKRTGQVRFTDPLPEGSFIMGSFSYYINSIVAKPTTFLMFRMFHQEGPGTFTSGDYQDRKIYLSNSTTGEWITQNFVVRYTGTGHLIYGLDLYIMGEYGSTDSEIDFLVDNVRWTFMTSSWEDIIGTDKPSDNADVTTEVTAGLGVNIAHPRYSLFEEATLPTVSPSGGTGATQSGGGGGYFGAGEHLKLQADKANHYCFMGESGTDYNFALPPNKKWILSAYVRSDTASAPIQLYVRTNDAHAYGGGGALLCSATPEEWTRVSVVADLTANDSTRGLFRVDNDSVTGLVRYDGLMIEEQIGDLTTPSAYSRPGQSLAGYSWGSTIGATIGTDLLGTFDATEVLARFGAESIAASRIVADSITAAQIAANTITAAQIFADTITAAEIAAGTITATQIAANTITAAEIFAGTITATEIDAATITGDRIAAATILAGNIQTNTITATQIAANTITAAEVAANTITADEIAANTITASQIAANTITAGEIQTAVITAALMVTGTITAASGIIANAAIDSAQIALLAVDAAHIANATISTAKIADAQITNALIADATIEAAKIKLATIDTAQIKDAAITNAKIGALAVDTLEIAGEAVTVPSSAYSATEGPFTKGSGWNEILTATFDAGDTGKSVDHVFIQVFATANSLCNIRALYGGVAQTIMQFGAFEDGLNPGTFVAPITYGVIIDTPGTGSKDVDIEVYNGTTKQSISLQDVSLFISGSKK